MQPESAIYPLIGCLPRSFPPPAV